MTTAELLGRLLKHIPEPWVAVSSLGRTSEVMTELAGDRTLFTDTMGDVTALATGLAIGVPSVTVVAVDTDGSFLMNLSVLPMLGDVLPGQANLLPVIIDNRAYESAGGLPSRRCEISWPLLFEAVGLQALCLDQIGQIPAHLPVPNTVIVASVDNPMPVPDSTKDVDGVESSYRIERRIAALRHRSPRRPAVKA